MWNWASPYFCMSYTAKFYQMCFGGLDVIVCGYYCETPVVVLVSLLLHCCCFVLLLLLLHWCCCHDDILVAGDVWVSCAAPLVLLLLLLLQLFLLLGYPSYFFYCSRTCYESCCCLCLFSLSCHCCCCCCWYCCSLCLIFAYSMLMYHVVSYSLDRLVFLLSVALVVFWLTSFLTCFSWVPSLLGGLFAFLSITPLAEGDVTSTISTRLSDAWGEKCEAKFPKQLPSVYKEGT